MLMRWSLQRTDVAAAIEAAVARALDDGFRTADLLPPGLDDARLHQVGTTEMTAGIIERVAIQEAVA